MKSIKLTLGKVALVDDVVYPFVVGIKWYTIKRHRNGFHAIHTVRLKGRRTSLYLHQMVWYILHNSIVPDGMEIDHKNRNGLDCQGSNLRLATHVQNNINHGVQFRSITGITGVRPRNNRWWAYIGVNSKTLHLGYYSTKDEAVGARRAAEIKYFGEFVPVRNTEGASR